MRAKISNEVALSQIVRRIKLKKRVFSLVLTMFLILTFVPSFADAKVYTKDDLQSLYDTVAPYIFNSEEILQSTLSEEEDVLCATPINVARTALLSPDFPAGHFDAVYRGLYSAFSMLSLVSQRNNSLTNPKVLRLFNALISLIANDDYYKIAPSAEAEEVKAVVEKSKEYLANPTLYAADDMHAQMNQLFITLHGVSVYKITDFNTKFAEYAQDTTPLQEGGFSDVLATDWFYDAVKYVCDGGLFKGTSDTTFSPSLEMTRGMFITVLSRFAKVDISADDMIFEDVSPDAYYAAPVFWANHCGLLTWIQGDTFSPDQPITREEMVTTMYNYCRYIAYDLSNIMPSAPESFTDFSEASSYAHDAIGYAHAMGIISGYEDGSLKPQGTATRAEVAQVFINLENALY